MTARTCACGHTSPNLTEHGVHVSSHTRAELRAMKRPASCWRCSGDIPPGGRVCPVCGWEHPGFQAFGNRDRPPLVSADVADLDHRGRPW